MLHAVLSLTGANKTVQCLSLGPQSPGRTSFTSPVNSKDPATRTLTINRKIPGGRAPRSWFLLILGPCQESDSLLHE